MKFTNSNTSQTFDFRANNIVYKLDGCLVVEVLFSGVVDLSAPSTNLAARIHPAKARVFSWIVKQTCAIVSGDGTPDGLPPNQAAGATVRLIPEVEIHVNIPQGRIAVRRFSEFMAQAEVLIETGRD